MKKYLMQFIYTAIGGVMLIGFAAAMDLRIDQRVQVAIDNLEIRQINQRIEFLIMKQEMAPASITPDDRVNRAVLERQLEQLQK